MIELHVQQRTLLSRAEAFSRIADHERFLRLPLLRTRIIEFGSTDRQGIGTLREARLPVVGMVLRERVVEFHAPYRLAYRIESMRCFGIKVPINHELGWLELSTSGQSTQIDWHTRFQLIGRPVEKLFAAILKPILRRLLNAAFPA